MRKRSHSEFQRDVEMRQRNVVFPDPIRNEARGWRSLITSKEPLSVLQVFGVLVLYASVLGLLFAVGDMALTQFHNTPGTGIDRVVRGFGGYIICLGVIAAAFLLLRWRVRAALSQASNPRSKQFNWR